MMTVAGLFCKNAISPLLANNFAAAIYIWPFAPQEETRISNSRILLRKVFKLIHPTRN
jgi:hypothetical protein